MLINTNICAKFFLLAITVFQSNAFDLKGPKTITRLLSSVSPSKEEQGINNNRRNFLLDCGLFSVLAMTSAPSQSSAMTSYSSNARNFERMNNGDYSAGSTYDNNPNTESGKKRRAMVGCKSSTAREEAADLMKSSRLSEKECNVMILGGESEFMLQALRNLDCPACPYGISSERN